MDRACENCRRYKKSCTGGLAKEQCEKIKLPQTEADRIRAMSDEELAETFANYVYCHDCPIPYCKVRFTMERLGCQANWLDLLKQEATE